MEYAGRASDGVREREREKSIEICIDRRSANAKKPRGSFNWNACTKREPERVRCARWHFCVDVFPLFAMMQIYCPRTAAQTPRLMMKAISVYVDGDYLRASFACNNITIFHSFVSTESTIWFWQNDSYCSTTRDERERERCGSGRDICECDIDKILQLKNSQLRCGHIDRNPPSASANRQFKTNKRTSTLKTATNAKPIARNDIVGRLWNAHFAVGQFAEFNRGVDSNRWQHRQTQTPTLGGERSRDPLTFSTVCFNSSMSNPVSRWRWFTMTK